MTTVSKPEERCWPKYQNRYFSGFIDGIKTCNKPLAKLAKPESSISPTAQHHIYSAIKETATNISTVVTAVNGAVGGVAGGLIGGVVNDPRH